MTLRNLLIRLLEAGSLDDEVGVRILKRDEHGVVTEAAEVPVVTVRSILGPLCICVEASKIEWKRA